MEYIEEMHKRMKLEDIDDNGSKESREAIALLLAAQSNHRYGTDVEEILSLLTEESSIIDRSDAPDFIIRNASGTIGIEHFEVAADSMIIDGKFQSTLAGASKALYEYNQNIETNKDLEKEYKKFFSAIESSTYYSSIHAFKRNFEKHLKNAGRYKQNLIGNGYKKLFFLIEMLSWNFVGLTAVGNESFDCDINNIPIFQDIVDIIATAIEIDAIILLFNNYPFYDSTVFAFTPQQATYNNIGVEIYEYAGNSEYVESVLRDLPKSGIGLEQFHTPDNYEKEKEAIKDVCKKAFSLIHSRKPCVMDNGFYETLVKSGVIPDRRSHIRKYR